MKAKLKRAIIICISLLAAIVVCGILWLRMPYNEIRELDSRYATISRGMKRDQVIKAMGDAKYRSVDGWTAWWDDELLGKHEDARVNSAIRYTVRTFYLPVTFEFTFDGSGEVVGRHRYD
jgi:hypothetical protein